MTSPLEGPIRRVIGKAMAPIFYSAVVSRTVAGEPDPETPWIPGQPVVTQYPCRAFVDTYSNFLLANSLILAGDVKVVILTDSLEITPTPSDTVTVRGKSYAIINVAPDPANATLTLQARG